MNIIRAANLYLEASDTLLRKRVSAAKEGGVGTVFWIVFILAEENIYHIRTKNKLKEITKPLYRGRVAKEQSKSGFGLGLAITKKIVEAHSGQLIIESEVGCGTKFIVSLPINRKWKVYIK